jgi:NAD(P)H-dependent flavin oxidoreductase YrpB (nitropropane dioxygenase family)
MASIKTRFTERFGVVHPLAQAGMAFAGQEPELALAVGREGGVGAIGVGFTPPDRLREIIRQLRAELGDRPFNINFITYFGNEETVRVAAEERVPVVSFHWGHPAAQQLELLRDAGVSVWEQVGTVADAERAAADGVDVIVAQGWEAGGHNYGGMGLSALVPAVVDAVGDRALVLAAGGIADGRGVAAALTLGADGVWVGTRLVASEEAHVHPEHHARLVAAGGEDTVLSSVFGPEMPDFNPMRLLKVKVVAEYNDRVHELPTGGREHLEVIGETVLLGQPHTKHKFDVLLPTPETTGDFEEMAWLAGQGVGLVHDIKPAAEIVTEMMEGAADILVRRAASVVR